MAFVTVAINALGQIQQGRYANSQAQLQAQSEEFQAHVEEQTALQTAGVIRRAGRRTVGAANAAYAGAGVVVGEGSAGEVERDITQGYEHDAYQAILEGKRRSLGLTTDATLTRIAGSQAQTAGMVNAVGSALQGGYKALKASGWRTGGGPGFAGTQAPAPVETRSVYTSGWESILKTGRGSGD